MLWTKLGMGLLGMAGKGLAGSGLLQTLSQGLGSGKGGGSGKGMGCGRGGSLHGSGMKGSRSGKDGKGFRQTAFEGRVRTPGAIRCGVSIHGKQKSGRVMEKYHQTE